MKQKRLWAILLLTVILSLILAACGGTAAPEEEAAPAEAEPAAETEAEAEPAADTGGEKYQAKTLHAALARFFEVSGVPVVDLLPVLAGHDPAELVVSHHDAHPNEQAHALFAEAIRQAFYARL